MTRGQTERSPRGTFRLSPGRVPRAARPVADELRRILLAPLGIHFSAPTSVALYLFGDSACLYNFLDRPVSARLNGKPLEPGANRLLWTRQ